MITPELVSYIENQLKNGKKKEDIISRLIYAGWYREDIDEGFSRVSAPIKSFDNDLEKKEIYKNTEEVKEEFIPNLMSKNPINSYSKSIETPVQNKNEENLNKESTKIESTENNNLNINTNTPILDFELLSKLEKTLSKKEQEDILKNNQNLLSSKDAMISTFSKDFIRANPKLENKDNKSLNPLVKWIVIILAIFTIIFGVYFVFSRGYIKFDNLSFKNIPILGGDQNKILIDGFSEVYNSQFYKKESDIIIKSSGNFKIDFLSGSIPIFNFPDEISIHMLGIYDKVNPELISFDNLYTIMSPSWVNKGVINLKHNNSMLFIPIDALSKVIEFTDSNNGFIEISDNQINSFFSDHVLNNNPNTLNIENILVNGMSKIIFENISQVSSNGGFNILEKDSDIIKDIKVRYFEIIPSDPSLGGLLDDFIKGSKVESFEFWVDKDIKIFKYKIILNIPSSYVSFSSDEMIRVEISSIFYDLNGENNISMPETSVKMEDFLVNIKDIKDRNIISSFKDFTDEFYSVSSSYGKKPNSSGSCSSPVDGSLFSSLGHGDKVMPVVEKIKNKINELNISFGENISCYSTAGTWAISIPLATDPSLYWCTDNTGETIKTTNKLSSASCQ